MRFWLFCISCCFLWGCTSSSVEEDAQSLCDCVKEAGAEWNDQCHELGESLEAKYKNDAAALEKLQSTMNDCQ